MGERLQADRVDRIEAEASEWVVRLGEGHLSPEQERAFAAWRRADPEHDRRFEAIQRTWRDIPALTGLAGLAPMEKPAAPAAAGAPRPGRRTMFGGLAAATAAAAAAWVFLMPHMPADPEQRYATELAQSRRIVLSDGSVVTLGARSSIAVRFTGAERRVVLQGGEAFFEIAHQAARPFLVEAGASLIRDIGTKFDVKLGAGTMHVSVQEGQVQIERAARADTAEAMLRAGQRAEIALARAADDRARIAVLPSQATGAWREGRLVYDNARLADLIADVNRYYAPGVRLATLEAGELRITASFRTNEIPAFMNALSATLPVKAEAGPDGAFAIAESAR